MPKPGTITHSGPGWASVRAKIHDIGRVAVTIGVQGVEAVQSDPEDQTVRVVDKAAWNEYGADGVPPRPFMRTTARRYRLDIVGAFRVRAKEYVLGRRDLTSIGTITGNVGRAKMQQTLTEGPWVPNAPMTVRLKKSSRPLIDTGQLRQSLRYQVTVDGTVKDVG